MSERARGRARLACLALAAACLALGIARGEPAIVLHKAVRVCMECIGLG